MSAMPASRRVMRHVFMHWSNVFAGLVSRSITGCGISGIVLSQALVVSSGVRFVGFTAGGCFEKSLAAPERQRHQPCHVERSTRRGDRADEPDEPAERDVRSQSCIPEYLVLGPETTERNDAADREPAGHERPVRVRHVLPQAAHAPHVLLVVHAVNDAAGA